MSDPETTREMWAVVAGRPLIIDGSLMPAMRCSTAILSLCRTGEAHAGRALIEAIRRALDLGVADEELVDGLMTGDPSCDFTESLALLEVPGCRDDVMRRLTADIVRDLFGDED